MATPQEMKQFWKNFDTILTQQRENPQSPCVVEVDGPYAEYRLQQQYRSQLEKLGITIRIKNHSPSP